MLIRYGSSKSGKRTEIARIYTVDEHGITRDKIDQDARSITTRLVAAGHQAYVVGGAVRDLLIGKQPKDFDVATDAHPRKVRKLFRNARIIGKRFRLVHVEIGGAIIEVSTFRSLDGENSFGTLEEDVQRRDFTMNALYYSPDKEQIVDYVGGYADVRAGRVRELLPLETMFVEDPVRMVRAVKYSAGIGFTLSPKLKSRIRKNSGELSRCSPSRMTEEVLKILQSGSSAAIFDASLKLGLLPYMLQAVSEKIDRNRDSAEQFFSSMAQLDAEIRGTEVVPRSLLLVAVADPFMTVVDPGGGDRTAFYKEVFSGLKETIKPITPPNNDVHEAVKALLLKRGINPPPKPRRRRRGRKPGTAT